MAQEGEGRAWEGWLSPGSSVGQGAPGALQVAHRLTAIRHHSLPSCSQVSCACQLCSLLPAFLINSRQIGFLIKKKGLWKMESLQKAAGQLRLTGKEVQRWGSPLREGDSQSGPRDHLLLRHEEPSEGPRVSWGWAWPLWPLEQFPIMCFLFRESLQGF